MADISVNPSARPWKAYYNAKTELAVLNDIFSLALKSDEEVHRIWEAANEKTSVFSGALRSYLHGVQGEGDPAKILLEYTWGIRAVSEISTLLATSIMLRKARLGNETPEFRKQELIEAIFEETRRGWPKECEYCS